MSCQARYMGSQPSVGKRKITTHLDFGRKPFSKAITKDSLNYSKSITSLTFSSLFKMRHHLVFLNNHIMHQFNFEFHLTCSKEAMTGWVTIRGTVFRFMQSFCSTFTTEPRFALRPLLMVFSSTAEYVSIH